MPLSRKVTVPFEGGAAGDKVAIRDAVPLPAFNCGVKDTSVASMVAAADETEMFTATEVLPPNGPLALNAAVTLCEPAVNEAVLKLALPFDSND